MMINEKNQLTLGATGDILLHSRLYKTAKKLIGYNFDSKMNAAKPLFDSVDLSIVNQESIIAGKELGLSSFPKFNSPVEIGDTLKRFGVDIVNIANNHALDKGPEGILKSITNLEKRGLPYVGAYKSQEDKDTLRIIEKNGLKICFLSYTRGTNGIQMPKDQQYLVSKYDPSKLKKVTDLMRKIKKESIADVIIASVHFGKEYHLFPSAEQKEVSASLADAGADVILGHHPHVLQPPEWIYTSRGTKSIAAYSLGNFFSGQFGLYRQIGAFFTVNIEKKEDSKIINITNPKMKLTFVDSTDVQDYQIHLFDEIVKSRSVIKTETGEFESKQVYEDIKHRLKTYMPDLTVE
ncbi:CapA family protein [Sutcliffiella horikoshii]|uniref:CapA family protein n=1 Tax=Sutcliffiella horikoshii TaxID=79883 RepID=UPI00384DF572